MSALGLDLRAGAEGEGQGKCLAEDRQTREEVPAQSKIEIALARKAGGGIKTNGDSKQRESLEFALDFLLRLLYSNALLPL